LPFLLLWWFRTERAFLHFLLFVLSSQIIFFLGREVVLFGKTFQHFPGFFAVHRGSGLESLHINYKQFCYFFVLALEPYHLWAFSTFEFWIHFGSNLNWRTIEIPIPLFKLPLLKPILLQIPIHLCSLCKRSFWLTLPILWHILLLSLLF